MVALATSALDRLQARTKTLGLCPTCTLVALLGDTLTRLAKDAPSEVDFINMVMTLTAAASGTELITAEGDTLEVAVAAATAKGETRH